MENNYSQVPVEPKNDGLCVAGFVVSIVSVITCGSIGLVGLILSIVGVIRSGKNGTKGRGMGIAGIIMSALSMLLFLVLLIMFFAVGASSFSNYLSRASEARERISEHNESVASMMSEDEEPSEDPSEDHADDSRYILKNSSFSVAEDWEQVDKDSNGYVFCLEGTYKGKTAEVPNNIMVTYGTNRYSKDDHMMFRDAILRQLSEQIKGSDVTNVNASGSTTANGDIVYVFDMKGATEEKVQYYIVGDKEYICVSAMIWDYDAAEEDNILEVAKDIVDSFEWDS